MQGFQSEASATSVAQSVKVNQNTLLDRFTFGQFRVSGITVCDDNGKTVAQVTPGAIGGAETAENEDENQNRNESDEMETPTSKPVELEKGSDGKIKPIMVGKSTRAKGGRSGGATSSADWVATCPGVSE